MKGVLIVHVIHIAEKRMIEAGIDGLSRENNLGGTIRGVNPLKSVPLYEGEVRS